MDCLGKIEHNGKKGNRISILPKVPKMFVRRCPRALIDDNIDALDYWDDYLTWRCLKSLPREGGTNDQDAKLIQAIRFISNLVNSIECDEKFMTWQRKKTENDSDKTDFKEKKFNSFKDIKTRRK